MSATMTYNELYTKMVNKFTIEKNDKDYKLGEYMLAKARKRKEVTPISKSQATESALPMPIAAKDSRVAALISYVQDKLTVKEAPIKNKTIRKFPIRSSLTAFGSAVVACSLVVVCAFFSLKAMPTVNGEENYIAQDTENELEEKTETASLRYEING